MSSMTPPPSLAQAVAALHELDEVIADSPQLECLRAYLDAQVVPPTKPVRSLTIVLDTLEVAINDKVADLANEDQGTAMKGFMKRWPDVPVPRAIFLGAWEQGAREVVELLRGLK